MMKPPYLKKTKISIEINRFHYDQMFCFWTHCLQALCKHKPRQTFLYLTLSAQFAPSSTWSIPLSAMDVKIIEIGFDQQGIGQETARKTCTRCGKLTCAETNSYLLSQCNI